MGIDDAGRMTYGSALECFAIKRIRPHLKAGGRDILKCDQLTYAF